MINKILIKKLYTTLIGLNKTKLYKQNTTHQSKIRLENLLLYLIYTIIDFITLLISQIEKTSFGN